MIQFVNSVSNDFLSTFVDSISVFDCRLPGVDPHNTGIHIACAGVLAEL